MHVVAAGSKDPDTLVVVILAETFIGEMLDLTGEELVLPCGGKATQLDVYDHLYVLNQVPQQSKMALRKGKSNLAWEGLKTHTNFVLAVLKLDSALLNSDITLLLVGIVAPYQGDGGILLVDLVLAVMMVTTWALDACENLVMVCEATSLLFDFLNI